jgi:hypothetical protein
MQIEQRQTVGGISNTSPITKALLVDDNGAIMAK